MDDGNNGLEYNNYKVNIIKRLKKINKIKKVIYIVTHMSICMSAGVQGAIMMKAK